MNGVRITEASDAQSGRRDRRIYTLKADEGIWKAVSDYQFITPKLAAEITGRDYRTLQNRLQDLYEANYLNRQRRDHLAPYVYFFSEKGAQEAVRLGFLPELRFIKSKSRIIINHDLEISYFHRAIEEAFGSVEWEQWRGDLKYEVEGAALIPDARFKLNEQLFFLEIVKSYESEYEDGESNILRKAGQYVNCRASLNFRVLWVLPTKARVLGLLSKLEQKYPYRRFYLTDEESYKTSIKGKIWWTPKDFRDATYSLSP